MSHYVDRKRKVAFERVSEAKILSDLRPAAERLGEPLAINRYRKEAPRRGWVTTRRPTGSARGRRPARRPASARIPLAAG